MAALFVHRLRRLATSGVYGSRLAWLLGVALPLLAITMLPGLVGPTAARAGRPPRVAPRDRRDQAGRPPRGRPLFGIPVALRGDAARRVRVALRRARPEPACSDPRTRPAASGQTRRAVRRAFTAGHSAATMEKRADVRTVSSAPGPVRPHDAVELASDALNGGPRPLVAHVGLQRHPVDLPDLEGVRSS